jgi:uncharacterized protein with HEPN domain
MEPEDRDSAYIWDMLDAASAILDFIEGSDFDAYLEDRKLQLAVERALEIMGEAARNVSLDLQLKHPEIPWKGIIAQRNVLAHNYGAIKQDLVWEVLTVHLPDLAGQLKQIISEQSLREE